MSWYDKDYCHRCGGYCGIDHNDISNFKPEEPRKWPYKIPPDQLVDILYGRIKELEAQLDKQRTTSVSDKIPG